MISLTQEVKMIDIFATPTSTQNLIYPTSLESLKRTNVRFFILILLSKFLKQPSFGQLRIIKPRLVHPDGNPPPNVTKHLELNRTWPPYRKPKNGVPRNCAEVERKGTEGIFEITIKKWIFPVYCLPDPAHKGPSWTIIQRRVDGSVNFNRNWQTYQRGFGHMSGEHWLGLRKIYELTNSVEHELWIKMISWSGVTKYAKYGTFYIGTAKQKAALNVSRYYGDAGDSLQSHNGLVFSTYDSDGDDWEDNCAEKYASGWWFNLCHER